MLLDVRGPAGSAPPTAADVPVSAGGWGKGPDALLAAAIILPLIILGACAWIAWHDVWASTEREVTSDADAVAEYANRAIGSHRLAGEFTNHLLRGLSDDGIRARESDLHRDFNALLPSLAGVRTISVIDREAEILMLANVYPVPPGTRVADREWFNALREPGAPPVFVGGVTTARLDGDLFFAVSLRRTGTGNGLPEGAFDGVVTVAVDPIRLSAGLANVSGTTNSIAALVRGDGSVLARSTGLDAPLPPIPADSPLRAAARDGLLRGTYLGRGIGPDRAAERRLIAFRRVGDLPIYATVARPMPLVLARWHGVVASQCVVGLPAWLAVIALAWGLRRGQRALAIANGQLQRRVEERTAALRLGEAQLRVAQAAARIGTWVLDPKTGAVTWSDEQYALFGLDPDRDGPMTYARFLDEVVHPDDRAHVVAAGESAAASGEFDGDFRVWQRMSDGERRVRWVTGRGRSVAGDDGRGRMFGVNVDISERKESEERQRLLMYEVDHRAKNVLALVQATLRLTPRDDPEAYARAVEGRVAALARAHMLLAEHHWVGASLREIVQAEVGNRDPASGALVPSRIAVTGPEVTLAPAAAQALSMALHELATNATKYGALGLASGCLSVTWRVDAPADRLDLCWVETGGPTIAGVPERRGFGSRVIEAAIQNQLGGQVERTWLASGLTVRITVPMAALAGVDAA